jgi:ankyrin repeat protein
MTKSIEQLRRDAKSLRRTYESGDTYARRRLEAYPPRSDSSDLKHADFLHVIARENGFESWPRLVWASETVGLDHAARQQRLKIALFHGQNWVVEHLLAETPDLVTDEFGLNCALYRREAVEKALAEDSGLATRDFGPRRPILHLAFSKYIHARPDLKDDMLAIADALLAAGADVDDGMPAAPGIEHKLSALYGAIGHANNMALGRWLLEHGADPNDGESLYHATELGHHEGLKMLLEHGANPHGTNALLRAMDFHDVAAVRMLLDAGALVDEFNATEFGGEAPFVVPALHQAARRMCSREMIDTLLDAGADPVREHDGLTPYAHARIYGNRDLAAALESRGHATPLTGQQTILARIADGEVPEGVYLDPAKMPTAARNIVRLILHLPGKLPHLKRLIAAGAEYDRPDDQGLTPVQLAGWEGLPEVLGYFLSLKPDLSHVNGYGGTLLSTIIHGSENCPERANRGHVECLRLALVQGVALPRRAIELAGKPEVSAFLADWAETYPGQVVEGGVA